MCICEVCGKPYRRIQWDVATGNGTTCSRACWRVRFQRLIAGEGHWNWQGGVSRQRSRGVNWSRQRRKALERDHYQCQDCGRTAGEERTEYGIGLAVHHIRPFRLFDDYREANRLDNLVTLCLSCHTKREHELAMKEAV
jgi:5-methylcytosine-specific restriction endonuclease McrA